MAVYEVWESQEAMQEFGEERHMLAMQELGFEPGQPSIVSIINVVQA